MSNELIIRENDDKIDEVEAFMLNNMKLIECPLVHTFTPGLYIRQIFMPATKEGTLVTSHIHKTCHPYNISDGKVLVDIDGKEWVELQAPFSGITKAGTRRVLYIIENCTWTTYHPLHFITGEENEWGEEEKDKLVDLIESIILEPHINTVTGTDISKDYKIALTNNKTLEQ